jgi:trimeric autotransporter adhesin
LGLGTNLPSRQLTTTQDIEVNSIRIGKGNGNVFNNLAIGYNALLSNTTGSGNLSVGYEALENSLTSNDNIAIGVQAMKLSTSANNNTAIGYRSLYKVGTTGSGGIKILQLVTEHLVI